MRASSESGGNGLLQFSQVGLSSSMLPLFHDKQRQLKPTLSNTIS